MNITSSHDRHQLDRAQFSVRHKTVSSGRQKCTVLYIKILLTNEKSIELEPLLVVDHDKDVMACIVALIRTNSTEF